MRKEQQKSRSAEIGELLTTLDNAGGHDASFSPTDKGLLVTKGKDEKTALLWEVAIQ